MTKLYDISDWCKRGIEPHDYPYIGSIEQSVTLHDIISVGGKYYAVCVLNIDPSEAGVRLCDFNPEPETRDYENNIICPFCGYENRDSWEHTEDDDAYECPRCSGISSMTIYRVVEYTTEPVSSPEVLHTEWVKEAQNR